MEYKTVMSSSTVRNVNSLFTMNGMYFTRLQGMELSVFVGDIPEEHLAYAVGKVMMKCKERDVRVTFFVPREARSAPIKEKELIHKGFYPTSLITAFTLMNTGLGGKLLPKAVGSVLPMIAPICDSKMSDLYFALSLWVNDALTDAQVGFEPLSFARFVELVTSSH